MNKSMNKSKSSAGYNPPQPVPIIHLPLVAYQDGQGPLGQVFLTPRAVLLQDFYKAAAIPPWTDVAEQVLRAELVIRGIDPWYLPPPRRILRKEKQVANFFWGLIFWIENGTEDGAERRSAHHVLYEAIRRLPGQAWFQETEGDAAYLQLWCRGIV